MGWIKLDRKIQDNWIWQDPIKLKWWLDVLLTANHSDATVNIGYQLLECKRGQSILSLKSWGQRWNVSKDTVRNFFNLLEKDHMITHENLTKTTRITVCNYEVYQSDLHVEQTLDRRLTDVEQTQAHPNKKNKKNKNEKEEYMNTDSDFYKFNSRLKTDCKNVCKLSNQITEDQFTKLMQTYTKIQIWEIMEQMENKKDLTKKYTSVYRTALNWLKNNEQKQ